MRNVIKPIAVAATLALAAAAGSLSSSALAAYPEKPIKVIVPYSPGGTSDVITRIMTQHLEKALGQKVVIVNVNGGAIALGHPLGCTGSKLSVQLINEMEARNQRYGMVTACVGGGQGVAGIIERLS